jgi:hypothetical protein
MSQVVLIVECMVQAEIGMMELYFESVSWI